MRDGSNMNLLTLMNDELGELRVYDLFMPNPLERDVEMLEKLFVKRDVKEIMNLPSRFDVRVDKRIWQWDMCGEYSVKSAYRFATEHLEPSVDLLVVGDWTKLWSMHVPFKVRQFTLRLARECLPYDTNLQGRGLSVQSECILCNCGMESSWHLFFSCQFAQQV